MIPCSPARFAVIPAGMASLPTVTIDFRYSRLGVLKALVLPLGFAVGLSLLIAYLSTHEITFIPFPRRMIIVVSAVMLAAVLLVRALTLPRGLAIAFTDEGLMNHRSQWPAVRWDQIDRIGSTKVFGVEFLVIHPKPDFPASIKRAPDGTTSFGFAGLQPGKQAAFQWLAAHHPELTR